MKRKTYLYLLFIIGIISNSEAQQLSLYNFYMLNPYQYNPAYAGMDESLSMTGIYRLQWVNFEGAPETQALNAHMPLYYTGGGIGLNFENESIGANEQMSFSASYSQRVSVGEESVLALGFSAGFIQRRLDGSILRAPDGDYQEGGVFTHNDDNLPLGGVSGMTPNFSAGLYFKTPAFEIGAAIQNLLEPSIDYGFSSPSDFRYKRNYTVNTMLNLPLSDVLELYPSALMRTDGVQLQLEATARFSYLDTFFGGASVRGNDSNTLDAVVILAGMRLNQNFTLGYGYDLSLNGLRNANDGSHEIMLNFNLNKPIGKGKLPKIIYNPRFL